MGLLSPTMLHDAAALFPCFPYVFLWFVTPVVVFHNLASGWTLGAKTITETFGYKGRCLYAEDMRKTRSIKCFFHRVFLPSSIPYTRGGR